MSHFAETKTIVDINDVNGSVTITIHDISQALNKPTTSNFKLSSNYGKALEFVHFTDNANKIFDINEINKNDTSALNIAGGNITLCSAGTLITNDINSSITIVGANEGQICTKTTTSNSQLSNDYSKALEFVHFTDNANKIFDISKINENNISTLTRTDSTIEPISLNPIVIKNTNTDHSSIYVGSMCGSIFSCAISLWEGSHFINLKTFILNLKNASTESFSQDILDPAETSISEDKIIIINNAGGFEQFTASATAANSISKDLVWYHDNHDAIIYEKDITSDVIGSNSADSDLSWYDIN